MTRRRQAAARPRLAGLLLALIAIAAVAPLVPANAPVALAATPSLTLTSDARYDVDPEGKAVHVSVALTATNRLKDTTTRQYYFDRAFLAVQPGTTNFRISARTGAPTVADQSAKADHTLLRIDFGRRLPAGSNRTFQLTFDIPDPGGAPMRETRVGASLVSFGAWAFASEETPGGSVTVVFPSGFDVDAQSEGLGEPTVDAEGRTVFTSGKLAAPLEFFAYFVADRPAAYIQTTRAFEVGGREVELVLRAWPDDPEWAERVGTLLERGRQRATREDRPAVGVDGRLAKLLGLDVDVEALGKDDRDVAAGGLLGCVRPGRERDEALPDPRLSGRGAARIRDVERQLERPIRAGRQAPAEVDAEERVIGLGGLDGDRRRSRPRADAEVRCAGLDGEERPIEVVLAGLRVLEAVRCRERNRDVDGLRRRVDVVAGRRGEGQRRRCGERGRRADGDERRGEGRDEESEEHAADPHAGGRRGATDHRPVPASTGSSSSPSRSA